MRWSRLNLLPSCSVKMMWKEISNLYNLKGAEKLLGGGTFQISPPLLLPGLKWIKYIQVYGPSLLTTIFHREPDAFLLLFVLLITHFHSIYYATASEGHYIRRRHVCVVDHGLLFFRSTDFQSHTLGTVNSFCIFQELLCWQKKKMLLFHSS